MGKTPRLLRPRGMHMILCVDASRASLVRIRELAFEAMLRRVGSAVFWCARRCCVGVCMRADDLRPPCLLLDRELCRKSTTMHASDATRYERKCGSIRCGCTLVSLSIALWPSRTATTTNSSVGNATGKKRYLDRLLPLPRHLATSTQNVSTWRKIVQRAHSALNGSITGILCINVSDKCRSRFSFYTPVFSLSSYIHITT